MPKKLENKKIEKPPAPPQAKAAPENLESEKAQMPAATDDVHNKMLQGVDQQPAVRQNGKAIPKKLQNKKIEKLANTDDTHHVILQNAAQASQREQGMPEKLENEKIQKTPVDETHNEKLQDVHQKLASPHQVKVTPETLEKENKQITTVATVDVHNEMPQTVGQKLAARSKDVRRQNWRAAKEQLAIQEKDDLIEQIEAGSCPDLVFHALKGKLLRYSRCPHGCRIVQKALAAETCLKQDEKRRLLEELHGHVQALCLSPHGNYVIQVIVETFPTGTANFVAEELMGQHVKVAKNRYGCRVLQRLAEHQLLNEEKTTARSLFDALLLDNLQELCRSFFGRYVIQTLYEQGNNWQKKYILTTMAGDPNVYARTSGGASILREAISVDKQTAEDFASAFVVKGNQELIKTARSYNGSFVIRTLLESETPCAEMIQKILSPKSPKARRPAA